MKKLPLVYRTLRDIPLRQLIDRFSFEAKYKIISKLEAEKREQLLIKKLATPKLRADYLSELFIREKEVQDYSGEYSFEFLNKALSFKDKIIWNSADYSRLWQFHLHYFDYFYDELLEVYEYSLDSSEFINKANSIINDWIDNNAFYSFDGWHPYTTSLRLVNWVYSFIALPTLASQKAQDSLWKQLVYLSKNKETFAGGNHLLENLRALIIAGLYFDNDDSQKIVKDALKHLEKELKIQVLDDGGHYEYSSSYHLLMTKLLTEIIISLKSTNWQVPEILLTKLDKMLEYSQNIRLLDGSYPLWNDASFDSAPSLDTVLWFGSSLLGKPLKTNIKPQNNPILNKLLKSANSPAISLKEEAKPKLTKLESSGYYFLKSADIELSFDAAPPCPKELPGHAHADCLGFNIYKNGQPLIIETGPSQYGSGPIRSYERSTAAHNTVVFDNQNQSEVWGGFRVGRKAQPKFVDSGQTDDIAWLSASHNGYDLVKAHHYRWIGQTDKAIIVLDQLSAENSSQFCSHLHLAPNLEPSFIASQSAAQNNDTTKTEAILAKTIMLSPNDLKIKVFSNIQDLDVQLKDSKESKSYYSPEMGKKYPRAKLELSGQIANPKIICMIFYFAEPEAHFELEKQQVSLQIFEKSLKWEITDKGLRIN